MFYKCFECGHIFEDGEEKVFREMVGECFGYPVYENVRACPVCGGAYEETVGCSVCGSAHLKDELISGVCEECAADIKNEYRHDINRCYLLASKHQVEEEVSINAFLASMFSPQEINEILLKELICASALMPVDCTPFIECDEDWFLEQASRRGAKD